MESVIEKCDEDPRSSKVSELLFIPLLKYGEFLMVVIILFLSAFVITNLALLLSSKKLTKCSLSATIILSSS